MWTVCVCGYIDIDYVAKAFIHLHWWPYINVELIILLIHVSIEDESDAARPVHFQHMNECCDIICAIQRRLKPRAQWTKGQTKIHPIPVWKTGQIWKRNSVITNRRSGSPSKPAFTFWMLHDWTSFCLLLSFSLSLSLIRCVCVCVFSPILANRIKKDFCLYK